MAKANPLVIEYQSIAKKLAGLSAVADQQAVEQLKLTKAAVVEQIRSTLNNKYRFKAVMEAANFDLLPETQKLEIGEQVKQHIAELEANAKALEKANK